MRAAFFVRLFTMFSPAAHSPIAGHRSPGTNRAVWHSFSPDRSARVGELSSHVPKQHPVEGTPMLPAPNHLKLPILDGARPRGIPLRVFEVR